MLPLFVTWIIELVKMVLRAMALLIRPATSLGTGSADILLVELLDVLEARLGRFDIVVYRNVNRELFVVRHYGSLCG